MAPHAVPPLQHAQTATTPPACRALAAAPFTQGELEQMLAPIALYPDALLSQILMASTYPLDVVEAAHWRKENAALEGRCAAGHAAGAEMGREHQVADRGWCICRATSPQWSAAPGTARPIRRTTHRFGIPQAPPSPAASSGACGVNWGRGDVDINVNRYNNVKRTHISNRNWEHNAQRRGAVPYRDAGSREQYKPGDRQAAAAREQFRGRDRAWPGAGAGTRDLSSADRGGASAARLVPRALAPHSTGS